MPLWFLIAMGLTGVVVVTRKGAKGAPVRRGSARAPAGGFAFPSGASGVSDGFPVYGSATGDNASNAASLGLTPDEFSHMTDGGGNASAPSPLPPGIDSSGAQSEAASLGLSDDEYAHMTDTSGNASAPSPQATASQDSSDAGDTGDQSVDMGSNVGTDMDPSAASFPGAEGTSVSGFTSYGEIHPTVGAPIVYDQDSNPYVMSPEGHLYPC